MYPNVKYELRDLERLILHERGQTDLFRPESVGAEVERIKRTLIHEVFTFEDERHLERYIQYHQQALIRLMDRTALFFNDSGSELPQFHQEYYSALEGLLRFIERHFTRYFDQDAKAPEGYIALARKDARGHLKKLKKELLDRNVDPRLSDAVLYSIKKVSEKNPRREITYRKVLYANEVREELYQLFQRRSEKEDINEELRLAIYYLNCNSIKVFAYHASYFDQLLTGDESRAEKIEKLSFALKRINQAQVKPGIYYNKDTPSIKEQLCSYLTQEIEYLEKLQNLNHNPTVKPSDLLLQGFKLKLDISVSQLAFLIKVFVETQIIQNKNITEVLRFLARYAITKRSESVSYDSFRAKFYNIETGTKEAVRNLLFTMIRYIDKN